MNKIKIICILICIPLVIFIALTFIKIKNRTEFDQKIVLAHQTRKVLEHLMFDLRQAHENSMLDLPADGQWHHRVAFDRDVQGILEYIIKDGRLIRVNNGSQVLIAQDIGDMRIRRLKATPDLLEVQVKAQNGALLISNFKIRIRE